MDDWVLEKPSVRHGMISADSHVEIPESAWLEYLDADLRESAPRLEIAEEGVFRVFEGRRTRIHANETLGRQAGAKSERFGDALDWAREKQKKSGASDPALRLADQDTDGVSAEILYFGGPLVNARDERLRIRSYSAYNAWLADFCAYAPKRLVGAAALPVESAELALAEFDNVVARGFRTAYMPLFPKEGSFADPAWEPLWARLADRRMPIGLHIGGLRREERRFDDAGIFMTQNLMARIGMAEALGEIIMCGVLQRHPELQVVSVEAQVGWMSFALSHMDTVWKKHRHWTKSPLEEEPSAYFRRQVFATFTDDPVGMREARHIGVDNLMWSSDYPHSETAWPHSREQVEAWAPQFDPETRDKLLWKNAARLYGLD